MKQEITAMDGDGHVLQELFIQQEIYQQPTMYQTLLQVLGIQQWTKQTKIFTWTNILVERDRQ